MKVQVYFTSNINFQNENLDMENEKKEMERLVNDYMIYVII